MSKTLLYIFSVFCFIIVNGQTVTSSCSAPDSILRIFHKSADKLAIRRVEYIGDTYKDSICINKTLSKRYLESLLAVYNATALPAHDTVMFFPILLDKRVPHELNNLLIGADSNQLWMKNLKNNILPCGEPTIDHLMSKYYFKLTGYNTFSWVWASHGVTFISDSNIYITRVCDKVIPLISQGVVYASHGTIDMDGFDITDSIGPNFVELKFKLAWGDCMAGCIYKRFWSFRVYNNCLVEYRGHYGDPLPYNILAGIIEKSENKSSLFIGPNPTSDKLRIELLDEINETGSIFIINSMGQLVLHKKDFNFAHELDISTLNNGVYYMRVNIGKRNSVHKLIIAK